MSTELKVWDRVEVVSVMDSDIRSGVEVGMRGTVRRSLKDGDVLVVRLDAARVRRTIQFLCDQLNPIIDGQSSAPAQPAVYTAFRDAACLVASRQQAVAAAADALMAARSKLDEAIAERNAHAQRLLDHLTDEALK